MLIDGQSMERVCIYGTKKNWREEDVGMHNLDKLGRGLLFQEKNQLLKMTLKTVCVDLYS
jgi:hypothetical protein